MIPLFFPQLEQVTYQIPVRQRERKRERVCESERDRERVCGSERERERESTIVKRMGHLCEDVVETFLCAVNLHA